MSLKKYWMKIKNCISFMNNSVQRGQNEIKKKKKKKTIITVTQNLETRNYRLRALSDVKKIISNQCDLHFTNAKQNTSPH